MENPTSNSSNAVVDGEVNSNNSSNTSSENDTSNGASRSSRGPRGAGGGGGRGRNREHANHRDRPRGDRNTEDRAERIGGGERRERNHRGAGGGGGGGDREVEDRGERKEREDRFDRRDRNRGGGDREPQDTTVRNDPSDRNERNRTDIDTEDRGERSDRGNRPERRDRNRGGGHRESEEPIVRNDRNRSDREHEEREDRGGFDRRDRNRGGGGGDRGERHNRGDRPDRRDRPDRGDRHDRGDRQDRGDRPDRGERQDRGDRDRGPRNGGRGRGARPREFRAGRDQPPERQNTLVIKDADNEFLRMLKQANEDTKGGEGGRRRRERNQDETENGRERSRSDHREFHHMQPSRVSKAADDRPHKACPVCLMDSPSLTGEIVQAITSCEHIYCFECALRLIFITNKDDCPICRQTLTKVVLTRVESLEDSKDVRDFLTGSAAFTEEQFKKFDKMVYLDNRDELSNILEFVTRLLWFNCTYCPKMVQPYSYKMTTKNQNSYEAIARHLRKHTRNLCDLCFFNLELFPYEYELYTDYEMDQHKRLGSSVGEAQVQHRMCHLCAEPGYYFNNEALATHCKEAHISCYVCNSQTIFFIDQPSLIEHVVEQHICCPVCRNTNGQIIGFLSVIELKSHAHVEHQNEKIDYETLAKQAIANATAHASFGGFDVEDNGFMAGDSNMSRREAFDVIDNLLRNRFSAERHLNAPSFNPKTENYILNFPGLEGGFPKSSADGSGAAGDGAAAPKGRKGKHNNSDVNLFPGSKYRMMSGKISGNDYEEEFPGLGGGAGGAAGRGPISNTIAAAAANVKYKPQDWSQPNQFRKTPQTSAATSSAPPKVVPGKKTKGGPPKPPVNPLERDLDDAPASIYDDMIHTNPLEAPISVGQTKPKSVQLIEAISTSTSSSSSNVYQVAPPPIEAFPALGRPSKSANPAGIYAGGSNWSKALANPKPKQKKAQPKKPEVSKPLESQLEGIDLNDNSFPSLSGGDRPSWMGYGGGATNGKSRGGGGGRWGTNGQTEQRHVAKPKKQIPDNHEWIRPNGALVSENSNGNSTNGTEDHSTTNGSTSEYITHTAMNDRNSELRRRVRQELLSKSKGNDSDAMEAFNSFKELSLSYRNDQCTVDAFFEVGRDLLGRDFFDSNICDLISLLPNIGKQTELYKKAQRDPKIKQQRGSQLWSCGDCGQLSIPAEKAEHQRYHQKATSRR